MFEKHKTGSHFCATCSNWALPQSVWRHYPETGKFRKDSHAFEETLVARERYKKVQGNERLRYSRLFSRRTKSIRSRSMAIMTGRVPASQTMK